MLALNETLNIIKQRMGSMSANARLLIGTLMTILVMALVIVGLLTGRSTMTPLAVSTPLSAESRTQLINYMDGKGIKWDEKGGRLRVAADQQYAILGELADSQLIDSDQLDFEKLVVQDNPFTDKASKRRNFLIAKMNVLARTFSQMKGIASAKVFIDEPQRPAGLGGSFVPPKASVSIATTGGQITQSRVDAIANFVVGAHSGLKLENVSVVVDGKLYRATTEDDALTGRYFENKTTAEKHVKAQISRALYYIPGVSIEVSAVVDNTRQIKSEQTYGEPVVGPLKSDSLTQSMVNRTDAGEAGVRPNTGTTIQTGAGRNSESSMEKSGETSLPRFPVTDVKTEDPKGYPLKISASVGVPESFLVGLYQQRQGDESAVPDQAALDALMADEKVKIEAAVTPLIDTGPIENAVAGTVNVYSFADFALPTGGGGPGGGFGGPGGGPEIAGLGGSFAMGDLVKGVGLGSLAVISLATMFLMVRKVAVRPELPSAEELVGIPPALAAAESDVVGEAGEADTALEGMEINEDVLRRQQMLDQINDTAQQAPDQMATLLRRWIKAEE